MRKHYKTYIIMLGIMAIINIPTLYERFHNNNVSLSDEGGFIENITAFVFLFSGLFLMFQILNKIGLERKTTQIFAITCIAFFFREVDVEDYNVPSFIHLIGQGVGRNILFISLYAIIIIPTIFKYWGGLLKKIVQCLKSDVSIIVLIACAVILLGGVFEKNNNPFFEELLEMNGAFLIMLASIIHLKVPIYSNSKNKSNSALEG